MPRCGASGVRINVFLAGFGKCGTTTLCALLGCHPGIFVPTAKETWFFCSDDYDSRLDELRMHYADSRPGQLLLDGTPEYSSFMSEDKSLSRILEHNSDARFIFIARDPKARIDSSFREMHNSSPLYGFSTPWVLSDALRQLPQMYRDAFYWERISGYREAVGDERILVLFLEDVARSQADELRRCFRFLGLDESPADSIPRLALNTGKQKLIDTRLLRWLRHHEPFGQLLARIPASRQDRWFYPLGLRRPFGESVRWDAEALAILREQVAPDARRFLEFYGKPRDFWPGTS